MLSHAENVFLLESFYKTGSVKLTQNEFRRRFGKEVDRRTVYRLREKLRDHGTITDRRVIIRIRDAPVVTDQFVNRVSRELKGAIFDTIFEARQVYFCEFGRICYTVANWWWKNTVNTRFLKPSEKFNYLLRLK